MMNQRTPFTFLLGVLLTGSTVVAEVARDLATSNRATADARRVAPVQPHASATEAASATATNFPPIPGVVATNALPPLPADVTELKFSEFFRQPIGPRGLEYSDKLRNLEGRRIRILGYMVRQEQPLPHGFMLAPKPLSVHEEEFGLCDDLPAAVLHVFTDATVMAETPYTPGLLLLTGTLSVGNRTEADGRISTVRLQLDPPTPEQQFAVAQVAEALASHKTSAPDAHAGHHH